MATATEVPRLEKPRELAFVICIFLSVLAAAVVVSIAL